MSKPMTNYNERLDKLMPCYCKLLKGFAWRKGDPCEGCINGRLKQAITSLTKEMVAEAKPEIKAHPLGPVTLADCQRGLDHYEANILKALEEV